MKTLAAILAVALTCVSFEASGQQFWERIPGPSGTFYVQCVAEDNANSIWYAGTPNGGGIYVSTNQGASWIPRWSGLPQNTTVSDIAIVGGGTVLALSGAIYRSSNAGLSWEQIAGSPTGRTNLHVRPGGLVFVGAEAADGGVHRSTDGGTTWLQRSTGLPSYVVGPFTYYRNVSAISSDASGNLYASVNSGNVNTEVGVYKSVNNGDSWTRMSNGLLANTNVKPVFVSSSGAVYVGVRNRVYVSNDGAASWTQTDSIPMASSQTINHIAETSGGQIIASTTGGTFRAAAGGTGWTNIGNPFGSATDFEVTANGLYLTSGWDAVGGVFGGIQKSTDGGATWSEINNGINNALSNALTVTPAGGIFNGLGRGRVDYSHDNGATFSRAILPYTGSATLAIVGAIQGNAAGIVVAGMGEGLFTSTNNGANWTKTSTNGNRAIALAPNGNFIAGGASGTFSSTNGGQSWTSLGGGGDVYSVFVTNAGTILAGTFNSGVNRLPSGGTWTNSGTTLFGNVTIGRFVQLTNGNIYVHTLTGMFRSTNDGETWATVGGTPVGVQYRTLTSAGGTLLLGTPSGLYMSTNEGGSWTNHATGLLNTFLNYLSLAPDGRLYGAGGAGIYRTVNPIITGVQQLSNDIPGEFRLDQNYPNPFNPSTTIRYQLPVQSHVTLKVYDVLGREVATLVNENLQPERYEVTFDAEGLASGVYVYRLTAGGFTQTKRMVLMR